MPYEEDRLFAEHVLHSRLVGEREMTRCVNLVEQGEAGEHPRLLPEVLAMRGLLTTVQIEEALERIHRSLAFCPGCGTSQYAPVDPDAVVTCSRCGNPLRRWLTGTHTGLGPRVVLLAKGNVQATFPLTGKTLTIGRESDSRIALYDRMASRRHAKLAVRETGGRVEDLFSLRTWDGLGQFADVGTQVVLEDLGSRNGTLLNGQRIATCIPKPGDLVRVGDSTFIYLVPGMPLRRDETQAVGVLSGDVLGIGMIQLPVTELAILIGRGAEADVRIIEEGTADFAAQVVAVSGSAQLTELSGESPRQTILANGAEVQVGALRLEYKAVAERIAFDEPSSRPADKHPDLSSVIGERDALAGVGVPDEAERMDGDSADVFRGAAGSGPREKVEHLPSGARTYRLTAVSGPCQGSCFVIGDAPVLIGRLKTCDIPVRATAVSRRHARIVRVEGDAVIEDLNSANGVFVNGRRIRRHALKPGDEIRIAGSRFLVHL